MALEQLNLELAAVFEPFLSRLLNATFSTEAGRPSKTQGGPRPVSLTSWGVRVTGMDQRRTTLDDPHSTRIEKTRLVSVLGWGRRGEATFSSHAGRPSQGQKIIEPVSLTSWEGRGGAQVGFILGCSRIPFSLLLSAGAEFIQKTHNGMPPAATRAMVATTCRCAGQKGRCSKVACGARH